MLPWRQARPLTDRLTRTELPSSVVATLSQCVYVCEEGLTPALVDAMRRLAVFSTPRFLELQAMRMSTARTPRVIACFEQPLHRRGFDDPRLDTLLLAMPIAWKGTVIQYTGRLHRAHPGKHDLLIYDYVDTEVPVLRRMFNKRLRAYRTLGYELAGAADLSFSGALR